MKKFILALFEFVLIGLTIFLIVRYVQYIKLDHTLQIEEFGFVKSDVTMLNFTQKTASIFCILGAIVCGIGSIAYPIFVLEWW